MERSQNIVVAHGSPIIISILQHQVTHSISSQAGIISKVLEDLQSQLRCLDHGSHGMVVRCHLGPMGKPMGKPMEKKNKGWPSNMPVFMEKILAI